MLCFGQILGRMGLCAKRGFHVGRILSQLTLGRNGSEQCSLHVLQLLRLLLLLFLHLLS